MEGTLIHIGGGREKGRGGFLKEMLADMNCEQGREAREELEIAKWHGVGKGGHKLFHITKAHVRQEVAGDKGREEGMRQAVC